MKNVLAHCTRHLNLRTAGLLALALIFLFTAFLILRNTTSPASEQVQPAQPLQVEQIARTTALHQQSQLQQAQQMLQALSGVTPRPAACRHFLARQLERFPQYINLAFVDTQGNVRCSAKPLSDKLVLPAMDSTQAQPHVFALQQNVALAVPHIAPDGRLQGAVFAVLPLADFFPPAIPGVAFSLFNARPDALAKPLFSYPVHAVGNGKAATHAVLGTARPLQLVARQATPVTTAAAATTDSRQMHWGLLALLALGLALLAWPWIGRNKARRMPQHQPGLPQTPVVKSPSDTQLLRSAYAELKGAFVKKEQRVRQLVHLDELSQRLQSCASGTELTDTVARCAQALFPGCEGALFLRNEAERHGLALAWGGSTPAQSLQTLDCHALHSGQTYISHGASARACAHAKTDKAYVCIPLQSGSGVLGLLFLAHEAFANERTPPWAATAIAERTSIALQALRRQEQLQRRAIRDALTGLFNRGFMEEALAIELRRAQRRNSSIGVMLLDVDHFKRYNDTYGHAAGDAVLRGIGGLLQRTVREGDMPCRYGGEEFVVILPGADLATTQQRAEALRASIEQWQPEAAEADSAPVTASIGVACYPQHGLTWQAVLKRADQALYAAKHAGRNRVLTADAYKTEREAVPA